MVFDALDEQGMTQGPNFFYITPFLDGRIAGHAQKPNEAVNHAMPFYDGALFFALLGLAKLLYRRKSPVKTISKPRSRDVQMPASSRLAGAAPQWSDLVVPIIPALLSQAQIDAAFANPNIAVAEIGLIKPAATVSAEVFSVPGLAYTPRDGLSAIITTPRVGAGVQLAAKAPSAQKIMAYAGLAALVAAIAAVMGVGSDTFGQLRSVDHTAALGKSILLWIGSLIMAPPGFKFLARRTDVRHRKAIWDPYERLAERDRALKDQSWGANSRAGLRLTSRRMKQPVKTC